MRITAIRYRSRRNVNEYLRNRKAKYLQRKKNPESESRRRQAHAAHTRSHALRRTSRAFVCEGRGVPANYGLKGLNGTTCRAPRLAGTPTPSEGELHFTPAFLACLGSAPLSGLGHLEAPEVLETNGASVTSFWLLRPPEASYLLTQPTIAYFFPLSLSFFFSRSSSLELRSMKIDCRLGR